MDANTADDFPAPARSAGGSLQRLAPAAGYGYLIHMKAIQITMDEGLLARLDADDEVRRVGRSAVLRRATAEYLKKRRRGQIREEYQRGYARQPPQEFVGWESEGAWLDE